MNEDLIQQQIEIFRAGLNENQEDIDQFINQTRSFPLSSIPILIGVYNSSDEANIKILAIASMICALKTSSSESYAETHKELANNPEISSGIKDMSGKSIKSENIIIRNFTSTLLSLLISIEREDSKEFVEFLVEKIQNKAFIDDVLANIIDIFSETMKSRYFSKFKNSFHDNFNVIFSICIINIIPSYRDLSYNLVLSACNYVNMIISFFEVIIEDENTAITLVDSFTELLGTNDYEVSKIIHSTLFILIKTFYTKNSFFMGNVISLVFGNINNEHVDNLSILITFWRDIAHYENSIHQNQICMEIFPQLSNILFDIIDPDSEILPTEQFISFDEDSLYNISINTIYTFTKTIPSIVFENVVKKLNEIYEKTNFEDSRSQIYALSLFLSITSSFIDKYNFSEYMKDNTLDIILDWAATDQQSEVKIMALYEVLSILDHCPDFITDMNKASIDKLLNRLIDIMIFEEGDNEIVFLYAQIINGISKLWKNSNNESCIQEYPIFGKLQEKIEVIYEYGIVFNFDNIIRAASTAISNIVKFGYSEITERDIIEWYIKKLDELENKNFEIANLNTRNVVQSELCMMISAFAINIKNYDLSCKSLEILDNFIINQYLDEAAMAIRNIICIIADIPFEKLDKYMEICFGCLQSRDPSSMITSCSLISSIFNYHFNEFTDKISIFLDALLSIYNEGINSVGFPGMHRVLSGVLSAIGSILASPSIDPSKLFNLSFLQNLPDYDKVIFDSIEEVNHHEVDFRNPEYEEDYLRGILRCYRGYCAAYMYSANVENINDIIRDEQINRFGERVFYQREKQQIVCLRNIANIIGSNANMFSFQIFVEFFRAYQIVITRCSNRNNLILYHKPFKTILRIANDMDNDKMKQIVGIIEKILSNRDKNKKVFVETIELLESPDENNDNDDDFNEPGNQFDF